MVEPGYLAKLIKDPALAINLAAITSPTTADKLGATTIILLIRYSSKEFLYSNNSIT